MQLNEAPINHLQLQIHFKGHRNRNTASQEGRIGHLSLVGVEFTVVCAAFTELYKKFFFFPPASAHSQMTSQVQRKETHIEVLGQLWPGSLMCPRSQCLMTQVEFPRSMKDTCSVTRVTTFRGSPKLWLSI